MSNDSNNFIFGKLQMTKIKLLFARILYSVTKIFFKEDIKLINRNGIHYEVDLSEGIDLSLFLFGNFQKHITKNKHYTLKRNAVIFDVGANIGSLTLRFAQSAPDGKVYAFEPTHYAFKKLLRNISLNPDLAKRIIPMQSFLSDRSNANHYLNAYSSWKVDGSVSNTHPIHGGKIMSSNSVPAISIDDFCDIEGLSRLDLIKIDTDGHELAVLRGASKAIKNNLPFIIFEIGLYILEENGLKFEQYYEYFTNLGYRLINSKKGTEITIKNYHLHIPHRSTIDILAMPRK